MQIRKELVERKFDVAARIMGWNHVGSLWSMDYSENPNGKCVARVGAVWLSKYGRSNRYGISEMCNAQGGENTIRYSCTGEEMVEYFDGIIHAAGKFAPDVVSAAWSASNDYQEAKRKG